MKRFLILLTVGLLLASALPAFADDADSGGNGSTPPPSSDSQTPAPTEVDLSALFTADQLSLLSTEEQTTLKTKLTALQSDQEAFNALVEKVKEWMNERLEEKAEKGDRIDERFTAKVHKQFLKLMGEAQKKADKKKKAKEKRAEKFAKPKVLQGWVKGVDLAGGLLLLKKEGVQGSVVIGTSTVVVIIEADGARVGALSDFQAGDRVFALVRRSATDPHVLQGLVVVKMPVKPKPQEDDDDDNGTSTPPADNGSSTPPQ